MLLITLPFPRRQERSHREAGRVHRNRLHAVPERPVKIVGVEALSRGRSREAFNSTAVEAKAEDLLTW